MLIDFHTHTTASDGALAPEELLRRADEIPSPVLLFHGDEDINVTVDHSKKLFRKLTEILKKLLKLS